MAWSASGHFRQFYVDLLKATIAPDLDATGALKLALFNNSITPDFDATAANSAYGAGTWVTGNEVSQSGQWATGGIALTTVTITGVAGGIMMLDSDDVTSGSAFTGSNIYGGLLYVDTLTTPVADQGLAGLYFGGTGFAVTSGTFSVQWSGSGIIRLDVA